MLLRAAHQLAWSAGVHGAVICLVTEVTLLHILVFPAPALLLAACNCTAEQVAVTEKESRGTVQLLIVIEQQCYLSGR